MTAASTTPPPDTRVCPRCGSQSIELTEIISVSADPDDSPAHPALDAYWEFLDEEDFMHGCRTWAGT